jgi:hypothetical protein
LPANDARLGKTMDSTNFCRTPTQTFSTTPSRALCVRPRASRACSGQRVGLLGGDVCELDLRMLLMTPNWRSAPGSRRSLVMLKMAPGVRKCTVVSEGDGVVEKVCVGVRQKFVESIVLPRRASLAGNCFLHLRHSSTYPDCYPSLSTSHCPCAEKPLIRYVILVPGLDQSSDVTYAFTPRQH